MLEGPSSGTCILQLRLQFPDVHLSVDFPLRLSGRLTWSLEVLIVFFWFSFANCIAIRCRLNIIILTTSVILQCAEFVHVLLCLVGSIAHFHVVGDFSHHFPTA